MSQVLKVVTTAVAIARGSKPDDEVVTTLTAGADVSLDALGLDSLARFEVIMQIEEALDIELDDDEVLEQQSVKNLVSFIEERIGTA